MVSGTTKTGFEYTVEEDALNDMVLVDILADESKDEAYKLSAVTRRLLPEDQRKALYDHVKLDTGRVPVDAITREVEDIFAALGEPGKN